MDGPRWLDLNADETAEDAVLPVEIRVKQGMALLDEKHGPEWVWRIDLDTLELASTCRCVIGQLYANQSTTPFADGLDDLFGVDVARESSLYGFDSDRWHDVRFPALQVAWVEAITRRRLELANA